MAQAFIQRSTAFTGWFDAQEGSLPADTSLKVTFDESDQPHFEVIRAAEAETEAESTSQARDFRFEDCRRPFSAAAALGSPRRVHRDCAASTPATRTVSDTTPETPQKAKHDMPAPAHQTAPVGAAKRPDDPVAVLQRVREALGPDPRVRNFPALSTSN
ncbi:hypothetical protein ACWD25_18655 [Streptomyces sp. NPDC002920]